MSALAAGVAPASGAGGCAGLTTGVTTGDGAFGSSGDFLLLADRPGCSAQIQDAKFRDETSRAAKGTCLNIAEGAGRVSRADKAECVEATEIAGQAGKYDARRLAFRSQTVRGSSINRKANRQRSRMASVQFSLTHYGTEAPEMTCQALSTKLGSSACPPLESIFTVALAPSASDN